MPAHDWEALAAPTLCDCTSQQATRCVRYQWCVYIHTNIHTNIRTYIYAVLDTRLVNTVAEAEYAAQRVWWWWWWWWWW
jgi:hypothetical protein